MYVNVCLGQCHFLCVVLVWFLTCWKESLSFLGQNIPCAGPRQKLEIGLIFWRAPDVIGLFAFLLFIEFYTELRIGMNWPNSKRRHPCLTNTTRVWNGPRQRKNKIYPRQRSKRRPRPCWIWWQLIASVATIVAASVATPSAFCALCVCVLPPSLSLERTNDRSIQQPNE